MTDEQLAKLPKWAQAEFRKLQRENEGMRAMFVDQPESPIRYRISFDLPEMTLPADAAFFFGDYRVDFRKAVLTVRHAYDAIVLRPTGGANSIEIAERGEG